MKDWLDNKYKDENFRREKLTGACNIGRKVEDFACAEVGISAVL
jgi:hypothetical protein